MARVCRGDRVMERLPPVFESTSVETRYFSRRFNWYAQGQTFEARNGMCTECRLDLAEHAARRGFDKDKSDWRGSVRRRRGDGPAGSALAVEWGRRGVRVGGRLPVKRWNSR